MQPQQAARQASPDGAEEGASVPAFSRPGTARQALLTAFATIAVALVLVSGAACDSGTSVSPTTDMLARRLYSEWRANPVRYEAQQAGRVVQANGTISYIKEDGEIVFRRSVFSPGLSCQFISPEAVMPLSAGDQVSIQGTVGDVVTNGRQVRLQDCEIAPDPEQAQ